MSLFGDVLGALATPPEGRNRRVSSNEQPNWNDGNFDVTPLAPGQGFELPVLEGPGVINHIWFTSYAGGFNELNALSLRIYFDDQTEPGVEVPLGDFFAVGGGQLPRSGVRKRKSDLLLADAVRAIRADRRGERQLRALQRPVLAGGLGAARSIAPRYPPLLRALSTGSYR